MNKVPVSKVQSPAMKLAILASALLLTTPLTGCIAVGASSRGGFFIWPGGLGALVIILVIVLLLRRR